MALYGIFGTPVELRSYDDLADDVQSGMDMLGNALSRILRHPTPTPKDKRILIAIRKALDEVDDLCIKYWD